MIMVDESVWGEYSLCHLTSDRPTYHQCKDELFRFADKLGLPYMWFHAHPIHPHYDLTPNWKKRALSSGAIFVPARLQAYIRIQQLKEFERFKKYLADQQSAKFFQEQYLNAWS